MSQDLLIHEVSRSHTTSRHTTVGRTPLDEWSARRRDAYLTTHNTHNRLHAPGGIQTYNHSRRAASDPRLRPRRHWDLHKMLLGWPNHWRIGGTCDTNQLHKCISHINRGKILKNNPVFYRVWKVNSQGRAITQAPSDRICTVETRIRSQFTPREDSVRWTAWNWDSFPPSASIFPDSIKHGG